MYLNKFSVRINGKSENSGYVEMNHGETYKIVLKNDHDVRCDASVEIDGKDMGSFRIEAKSNLYLERPSNEQKKFTFYQLGTSEADQSGLNKIEKNEMGLIKVTFKPEKPEKPQQVYSPVLEPISYQKTTYRGRDATPLTIELSDNTYYSRGETTKSLTSTPRFDSFSTTSRPSSEAMGMRTLCMHDCEAVCESNNLALAGGTGLSGSSSQRFIVVPDLDYDDDRITEINIRLIPVKERRQDPVELKPVVKSTPVPPPLFTLI